MRPHRLEPRRESTSTGDCHVCGRARGANIKEALKPIRAERPSENSTRSGGAGVLEFIDFGKHTTQLKIFGLML